MKILPLTKAEEQVMHYLWNIERGSPEFKKRIKEAEEQAKEAEKRAKEDIRKGKEFSTKEYSKKIILNPNYALEKMLYKKATKS